MYPEHILKLYLQAIDVETLKEKKYRKMFLHQGYYNTIVRYIENRNTLSINELLCMLSLYSIENIPRVEEAVFDGLEIIFVPQPKAQITGAELIITITFAPQPKAQVVMDTAIIFVGQGKAQVVIDAFVTFAPQIKAQIVKPVTEPLVVFAPQPKGNIEGVDNAFVVFAPQPKGSMVKDGSILFVPQPKAIIEKESVAGGQYFWGFAPYRESRVRSFYVSYMQTIGIVQEMLNTSNFDVNGFLQKADVITSRNIQSYNCTNFERNLPVGETAYNVILIPETAQHLTQWQNNLGGGIIGGQLNEGFSGNHWPNPDAIISHEGIEYYLYVGNRRRRYTGTILLIS